MTIIEIEYQGFTYDELSKHYSYDPIAGKIISTYSGMVIGCQNGTFNRRVSGRGQVKLSAPIVAMILYEGKVTEGMKVKVLDKDKSNLKLSNLLVVNPDDEPVGSTYCKPTHKEGVVENIYRGCFVVRGNEHDAVYFTKTLEEAIEVRKSFELTGILAKHPEAPYFPDWLERKPTLW